MVDVDNFIEFIKRSVARTGKKLAPNGDWLPMLVVDSLQGMKVIAMEDVFRKDFDKEVQAKITIPRLIYQHKAKMAAYLSMGWFAKASEDVIDENFAKYGNVSSWPEDQRVEKVACYIISPAREVLLTGLVQRSRTLPPTVVSWEIGETGVNGQEIAGLYPAGMRVALRGRWI